MCGVMKVFFLLLSFGPRGEDGGWMGRYRRTGGGGEVVYIKAFLFSFRYKFHIELPREKLEKDFCSLPMD